jgi:hypothetical protein
MTTQLIESAQNREFTEFDQITKSILENKIANKMNEMGYFSRLAQAKNIFEEDTEYQKQFKKLLSKYKVDSPADLDDEAKKKFFDEVELIKKD